MAYDETLAERVRDLLDERDDLREQPMFGGLSFMVRGNLACGVLNDDLVVRLSHEDGKGGLAEPHARPMDFTGRPMRGWLYVGPAAELDDASLESWVERSLALCLTLKPK